MPETSPMPAPGPTVVDASGLVLGRAASVIAKRLLNGESIVVVNAEKSVVTVPGQRHRTVHRRARARVRAERPALSPVPRPHLPADGPRDASSPEDPGLERVRAPRGPHRLTRRAKSATTETLETAKARPALRAPMTLAEITRTPGGPRLKAPVRCPGHGKAQVGRGPRDYTQGRRPRSVQRPTPRVRRAGAARRRSRNPS